jgi:hypothetical protein
MPVLTREKKSVTIQFECRELFAGCTAAFAFQNMTWLPAKFFCTCEGRLLENSDITIDNITQYQLHTRINAACLSPRDSVPSTQDSEIETAVYSRGSCPGKFFVGGRLRQNID